MGQRCLRMILLTMAALTLVGCGRMNPGAPTPTRVVLASETDADRSPHLDAATVVASGEIVPAQEARPGFAVFGRVEAVVVAEGDEVRAGEALVTLETDLLEADLAQAEAALAVARAQRALLDASPRAGEIAAAEAQLEAAESSLAEAIAQRDQLTAGAVEANVAAAQAQLAAAEAEWMSARITHDQLQDRKREDRKKVEDWEEEEVVLRLRAAERSHVAAEIRVAQAEDRAEVQVRAAQAAVTTAAAQRDAAQAQLALLQAEATSEEIAAGESAMTQAEAAVDLARAALAQATLRAPSAGTITALEVSRGETVMPGQRMLTLADLQRLQVETTDLSERDVDQVSAGQRARVYVEGLGVEVGGEVVDIAPQADTIGGDVVYPVTIELDEQPSGLRWGMSVEVEIGTS
jgi:HlyD family secretion protein